MLFRSVADVRNDVCPIYVRSIPSGRWIGAVERRLNKLRRFVRFPGYEVDWHFWSRYPLEGTPPRHFVSPDKLVDFCRGPAELADAVRQKRACRLSAKLGLHITELIEGLQYPERFGFRRELVTEFDPINPLPAMERA